MGALTFDEAYAKLSAVIDRASAKGGRLKVLEAGGGSISHLKLPPDIDLTVIDISQEQLDRNAAKRKILADLHTVEIEAGCYDLVVCWDVIEHLEAPGVVVEKLARSLKPGGLLLLACPNRNGLSGLVTRLTPHAFHVLVLRHIFGVKTAGMPGHAPFHTVHHRDISLSALVDRAQKLGLHIEQRCAYESRRLADLRRRRPMLGSVYDATTWLVGLLSRTDMSASDLFLLLRCPSADSGRA